MVIHGTEDTGRMYNNPDGEKSSSGFLAIDEELKKMEEIRWK